MSKIAQSLYNAMKYIQNGILRTKSTQNISSHFDEIYTEWNFENIEFFNQNMKQCNEIYTEWNFEPPPPS